MNEQVLKAAIREMGWRKVVSAVLQTADKLPSDMVGQIVLHFANGNITDAYYHKMRIK